MKNNILNTIRHWQDIKMKLVFESILVGLITGIVVVAYRIMLDFAGKLSTTAYRYEITLLVNPYLVFIINTYCHLC